MPNLRKQVELPEGMALVQTADDKWFPAFATFSDLSHQPHILHQVPAIIPPALAPFHDPAQGYYNRDEAVEACCAWHEAAVELPLEWQGLAARTELYPERNAWYLDEIAHLAGDESPRLHCGIASHAVVLVRQTTGNNGTQIIAVSGNTPDEAIESLYLRVYEWARKELALAEANSMNVS
jgi:hypothetical protein